MKWLKKVKAEINLENDIIKINRRKTQINIPISCKRTKKIYENLATYMVNLLFDKPQKKIKKKEIILNNELSKEEQHQLNELLKEFEDIISIDENPRLERTGIIKHEIKVTENPIKSRPYPVKDNKRENWNEYISPTLFAYRTKINKSTQFTSFHLTYGREAILPFDEDNKTEISPEERVEEISTKFTQIKKKALENVEKSQSN